MAQVQFIWLNSDLKESDYIKKRGLRVEGKLNRSHLCIANGPTVVSNPRQKHPERIRNNLAVSLFISTVLPFCVGLWKVTQAMASPAKSPASVSGPGRTRWRRFPTCPCAQTSFWTGCKTHTGCRWTACTGRSDCIRRRARPGTAWRRATARPPRLSRCWRAAPRVDSPETPTSQRTALEHTTIPLAEAAVIHETAMFGRHPALLPPPIWGFFRWAPSALWGVPVCAPPRLVLRCERCAGMYSA